MPATPTESAQELRKRAEEKFRSNEGSSPEIYSPEEYLHNFHDLEVHQIELEMQNEELRHSQEETETSKSRYFDLYDLAPVGYLTLSEKGLIHEANLTAATMFGVFRNDLLKKPISQFIFPEDKDVYYQHRKFVIEKGEPQGFEIRLLHSKGSLFWAQLQATQAVDGEYRIILIDISERKRSEEASRVLPGLKSKALRP
jgi:PAS domain S-box-containing protein